MLDSEGVAMVATDGHRLSYARQKVALKITEPTRVLVPRKAIHELARLLEGEEAATFQQVENHLVFSVGERTLASKTIEGQFPAFEKVIAVTGDKTVAVEREALATAIRRVSLLSSDRSRAIRLGLRAGRIELLASSPDQGEAHESLAAEYAGRRHRDRLQRAIPARLPGRGGRRRREARAQGRGQPGCPAAPGDDGHRVPLRRHAHAVLGRVSWSG